MILALSRVPVHKGVNVSWLVEVVIFKLILVSVEVANVKLVEVAELMVRDEILLLKVVQSAEVSSPRFEAEAEGKLKVMVFVLVET